MANGSSGAPGFDVNAARRAGYSDDEILQHLTQTRSFNIQGALSSGYNKGDIINYLAAQPAPNAGLAPPASPGVPQALQNAPTTLTQGGQQLQQIAAIQNPQQRGQALQAELQRTAQPFAQAAQMSVPVSAAGDVTKAVASKATEAIPSFEKASEAFEDLKGALGQHTVDITQPGNTALDISDYASHGGSMPKVVRDFIKRTTDPNQGPLTYNEARDFYSNASRLSADEFNRLTPQLQRYVGQFASDLGDAIKQTADQAGRLQDYLDAMAQYRGAAKLAAVGEAAKEAAIKYGKYVIPGAATAWAAKEIFSPSK